MVAEDAAQAHGAFVKDKMAGSLGIACSFSFQALKNMTAGEGDIVTTNYVALAERMESLAWSGRVFGMGWYSFSTLVWNACMTELQGVLLTVQLARRAAQIRRRQENAAYLNELLQEVSGVDPLPMAADPSFHVYHLYIMRYREEELEGVPRRLFIDALQAEGIPVSAGYPFPLYKNPMFLDKNFGAKDVPSAAGTILWMWILNATRISVPLQKKQV